MEQLEPEAMSVQTRFGHLICDTCIEPFDRRVIHATSGQENQRWGICYHMQRLSTFDKREDIVSHKVIRP
ncbi:ASN_collapsed_G0051520.mRNA.1.CDS.1 [Saccharomyces cerevisiae]|nr:ASN_collapsed_G0051520.mRNA.1.CDS.1 [Saccharomyces cerevisiae]